MQGRRRDVELHEMEPGDYGRPRSEGMWVCRSPSGRGGNLSGHTVTEHEDGTITVSPSILIDWGEPGEQWHGYLERGSWREV
jgi:hypothetical protein